MIPLEAAAGSRACDGRVGEGLTRLSLSTSRIPNTLSTCRGNWGTWALFIPLRWTQKRLWSRLHRGNHFFNLRSQLLLLRHHWRPMQPPSWVPSQEVPVRFLQSENGYPRQYSGLEISVACIIHGVTNSRTSLSDFHFHSHFHDYITSIVNGAYLESWY